MTQSKPLPPDEAKRLMAQFIPASEPKTQEAVTALISGAPITKAMLDAVMVEMIRK